MAARVRIARRLCTASAPLSALTFLSTSVSGTPTTNATASTVNASVVASMLACAESCRLKAPTAWLVASTVLELAAWRVRAMDPTALRQASSKGVMCAASMFWRTCARRSRRVVTTEPSLDRAG